MGEHSYFPALEIKAKPFGICVYLMIVCGVFFTRRHKDTKNWMFWLGLFLIQWLQVDDGGAPSAVPLGCSSESGDVIQFVQNGMHPFAQGSGAFAVDDPDAQDALFTAGFQIVGNQVTDFVGAKGVEVEFTVDGDFDGIFRFHGSQVVQKPGASVSDLVSKGFDVVLQLIGRPGAVG